MNKKTTLANQIELERWLRGRPREVACSIAWRAAARALPIWWLAVEKERWAKEFGQSALPALRAVLTSMVGSNHVTESISRASQSAYSSASTFADEIVQNRPVYLVSQSAACSAGVLHVTDYAVDAGHAVEHARHVAGKEAWEMALNDLNTLQVNERFAQEPLWLGEENATGESWWEIQAKLHGDPIWSFWLRWYQSLLDGTPMNPNMLADIALIEPEVWDAGPGDVAARIDEIERDYRDEDPTDLGSELRKLQPPKPDAVATVRAAMENNRAELPPTYDALESLILLEIERLQNRNFRDDLDREECCRQIGVFLVMHSAVVRMRAQVPASDPVSDTQAAETLNLWRVFKGKIAALPREKIDEVVDGVWETGKGAVQFGLIAGSTHLATKLGVPPQVGMPVSALLFAPKKAGDIIKAAKELYSPKSG